MILSAANLINRDQILPVLRRISEIFANKPVKHGPIQQFCSRLILSQTGKLDGTSDLVLYQGRNADGKEETDTVFSISFAAETYRLIESAARQQRVSIADLIKAAVEQYQGHNKPD